MLPYSPGDHRRSPPPPPRAVFSSSLSPSAAPFPAADPAGPGRDLPTAPSVYAAAGGTGEWANASWIEPPVSYMAPVAAASATPPAYNKGEAPYSTPYGIYSRIHFTEFPGLPSLRPESSSSIREKHPGTCQESSEALSNGVGPSVFLQQQNSFVSKLLDHSGAGDAGPYPRQDLNQYPLGSAYDKYMTQLSSCSTDTQPHILSTRYVNSSEMTTEPVPVMNETIGESSFSFSSYMNPCRISLDYFDCGWNEQKDIGYQTADKKDRKWSNSLDNMVTVGNYPLNPPGENRLGAELLGNGRPVQESSEMKNDLGSSNSKFSSSEIGFLQPSEFSSELPEVNNTSVDSPCWKGTPATYLSSFGIMENTDLPHTTTRTVGYNSSYQSQKAPELSFGYPGWFPRCQEASNSDNDLLKTFQLPVGCENSKDHEIVPNVVKVHNDMVTHHARLLPNKQDARTQNCYGSGEGSKNLMTSSQQESSCPGNKPKLLDEHSGSHTGRITEAVSKQVPSPSATTPSPHVDNLSSGSPHGNSSSTAVGKEETTRERGEGSSECCPGAEGNMLNMSCDSSSSTRAIFLKLMHNLSVVLLSTCKDDSLLQEDEEELLQSVIQNLTKASSKRSKVQQKTDDCLSNSGQMRLKNINCGRNKVWMGMHEHSAAESADLEFKTVVSQVVTALPEDKVLDGTQVSEASIYKKLWIDAEASACKLKYELQLARMKLATMKDNALKVPDLSEGSNGSNTSISSSKLQNQVKEGTAAVQYHGGDIGNRESPIVNRTTVNGVDDDVFPRLQVLQSRSENVSSFGEADCEGHQEKAYGVEDAVMARLKVLKSRPDNVTSSSQESMPDASTNRADNIHDAVMARLRILESRPNNVTFLGQESSKQQLDAGTNREDDDDDAVMARLRILKSRPDNVTSMGDVSKENEEACNDRLNRDGIEVIGGRQIVNVKQIAKFVRDFVDGTCAGENKAGGSADVASPKRFEAPTDEISNKDAIQGEDDLGEKHVGPQTAGGSHVCTEGSQEVPLISSPVHQYGSSPSEWEHVLKENFFHPGK